MKKTGFFIMILIIVFVSCKKSSEKKLKNFIIGSWETTYMKIEYPTDSTTITFTEDFKDTSKGKAQSSYKNDGTFSAWFLQPDGKRVGETVGNWKTKGDSLFVDYPYVGKQVQAWYHIKQKENGFEGKVIYDWDNDGEFDDTLFMKTKRIDLR